MVNNHLNATKYKWIVLKTPLNTAVLNMPKNTNGIVYIQKSFYRLECKRDFD